MNTWEDTVHDRRKTPAPPAAGLAWGDLKDLAKSAGIAWVGKKRPVLEAELAAAGVI